MVLRKSIFGLAVLAASQISVAQGLGQRTNAIEEVVVSGVAGSGSRTAPSLQEARAELERIPGGIGFVESSDFLDDFAQSLGDTLVFTPGIFADTSAQRENRISLRGSGLNSSYERRGLTVLRDGVPITRASGSTEFQEMDPLSVHYLEVYKGANGLRYGAASLGGAVNIVTATGRTVEPGASLRVEAGSDDTRRSNLSLAAAGEQVDGYLTVTRLNSDGYREHSEVDSEYLFGNIGVQLSDALESRFYFTALRDTFELAGSLSRETALEDREATASPVIIGPFFPGGPVTVLDPGPVADDWDRNLEVVRFANRTVYRFENVQLDAGAWYSYRGLDHAITRFAGIIDHEETEWGVFSELSGTSQLANLPLDWVVGARHNRGDNDAKTFENNSGREGALRTRQDQESRNTVVYSQADLRVRDDLSVVAALQYLRSTRDNDAVLNATAGEVDHRQFNPRLGLLWDAADDVQVFVNASRGFEPPSMTDLTSGGALPFTELSAQRAWTLEVGTRGQRGPLSWDVAIYRSWLNNEMLDFGAPGARGFVSFTDNAEDTIHQGLEAGWDVAIARDALERQGLALTWRNALTVNDFYFDDDDTYSHNKLAGVPDVLYVSELRLSHARWYAGVSVRRVPSGPYVDFANTERTPGYTLLGLNLGWQVSESISLFASAENLEDEHYIANITTVADQSQENSNIYTPGQGRAFFAGISLSY
ncbi:iron complex outermembrane receptor protein [Litorivivens lipolytica]|uniref:Iron complex outermembrane receptor protein n=1 Tax=Litorivivens lipolytica TaxID=1524264 RepID=A0A7W4W6S5_9GAMM|nr:TonB-dependent receptor [Litorivivens lipolytica]MBB3048533.1 iron complex outermembrane receptor protein [Litorivivens lipolytica]